MKKTTQNQWDGFETSIGDDGRGDWVFSVEAGYVPGECQERANGVMESKEHAEAAINALSCIMNDEPLVEPVVRVGVAVWIYNKEGRILMGLRKGSHGDGTWSLPGGHVDFGEHPTQTVRREVLEETGMKVGKVIPCIAFAYGHHFFREENKQYITLFFNAQWRGDEPKLIEPDKCERWEWFALDNLPSPLFGTLQDNDMLETMAKSRGRLPQCLKD